MRTTRVTAIPATLLTVTLALTLTACFDKVAPTAPALTTAPRMAAGAAGAGVERPWSGDCDVNATFTSATALTITGTCQYAHLGRTTVLTYQTITPGESGIGFTNVSTYTAANGDELHTTDIGVATPTSTGLRLDATQTAVGGTGRFANAHGTATLTGAVVFTGPTITAGGYRVSGRLTY